MHHQLVDYLVVDIVQNNTIEFVTIASTGNATDFGNLSVANKRTNGLSNATRGVFGGGQQ